MHDPILSHLRCVLASSFSKHVGRDLTSKVLKEKSVKTVYGDLKASNPAGGEKGKAG